jgi:hypothetical protein
MMEQEITCIVEEYQQSTTETATDAEERHAVLCTYSKENPCLWDADKDALIQFEESDNGNLTSNDISPANLCWKQINGQMALTIAGGLSGKGVSIELPICVKNGVSIMFLAEDGNYMGHMET